MNTPWGISQTIDKIGYGIIFVSTASHGGYILSSEQNKKVPIEWQNESFHNNGLKGFYEEDCDWAMVALTFPEYFKNQNGTIEAAKNIFKACHPNLKF